MTIRWRGRGEPQEQVANACDSFVDLTPASEVAAEATRSKWAALLPDDNDVPLIWEDIRHGWRERQEEERC